MATFKAVVFSTKNHIKKDGTSNIKIRIYHNKESQYIPTQYFINPIYLKNGEVSGDFIESDLYNYEIGEIIQNYRKLTIQIGSARLIRLSCMDLKNYLEEINKPDTDEIDFVKFSKAMIKSAKKDRTADWYHDSLNALIWFVALNKVKAKKTRDHDVFKRKLELEIKGIHDGKTIIDVKDITSSLMRDFIEQLKIKGQKGVPLENGSISNYIRGISALFGKARLKYNDEDLGIIRIQHNPFGKGKVAIPKYKRKRKNIGISEVTMIRDGNYDTFRENFGRDIFMIMFYLMGINAHDLYNLKPPIGGRIEYDRSKTDTDDNQHGFTLSIKIEPELKCLLDKYSPNGFLSVIKNRYTDSYNMRKAVNKGLAKICEDKGIRKVTSNWARHTWSSLARNKAGIPKADIDFCLGHVNNDYKMADIYIEEDYSIYDEVNRKVLDLIK